MPIWQNKWLCVTEKSVEIPTVTPTIIKEMVCFTLGSKVYRVGEEIKEMEVAPYASSGRTMLPVKYVADALGISARDIVWNSKAKTVTIYTNDIIVLTLGSKVMKINGESVYMSAMPEVVSERTFIPVAEITRALHIETHWDHISKQVTFETNKIA